MKVVSGIVSKFGQLVIEAENTIRDSIANQQVPDEPSITNRFLQQLETTINRSDQMNGIRFRTRTLSSLGPNAEEKEVGADFIAVINIQLAGFSVSKGFLCQAKRVGRGVNVDHAERRRRAGVGFDSANELNRLKVQVNKMLDISPDSYVLVYKNTGFIFVPALSISGIDYSDDGNYIYGKNTRLFFQEFLMCFIGDHRLGAIDPSTLAILAKETKSRYGIIFQLRKGEE